jgi:hypothetical protein
MRRTLMLSLLLALLLLPGCTPASSPLKEALIPTALPTPQVAQTQPAQPVPAAPAPEKASLLEEQALALLPSEAASLASLADIALYELDIVIDYPRRYYTGVARIHYTNRTGAPLESVYFHLLPNGGASFGAGSLQVTSVLVNGDAVKPQEAEGGRLLEIPFTSALPGGNQVVFELEFKALVPENFGGTGYGLFNYMDGVMVITAGYPLLAVYDGRGWNLNPPSNIGDSVYAEASFYSVQVEAQSDLVLAATGTEVDRLIAGSNTVYRFASGPVREFALVMSPDFEVLSQEISSTRLNSYYLPGTRVAAQEALDFGVESLQVFNQSFGVYPYNELDLLQVPLRYAAGVEFPGIVLLHRNAYLTGGAASHMEDLVAHEVAHQWWYNVVGNNVFIDPWLDEALATFSSARHFEVVHGKDAYDRIVQQYEESYARLVRAGRDEPVASSLEYFESAGRADRYGQVVYVKGALFLHRVRQEIGDENFFGALQDYYQAMKYQIASPEDLLSAFETRHGASLQPLFDEWLFSSQ